ncbi:TonB-dependent receptor [Gemmatimonas sp.]|uniref:TonB-dependent receptor n=1 Tax=Gemmatimonas sp. TaxID=1962908 RepID=UPI003983A14B
MRVPLRRLVRGAARCRGPALTAAALLVLLASTSWPLLAQSTATVTGKVTDQATGQPLQGASILLVGTQRGALTREDGSYRFTAPAGGYELQVRYIGYGTKRAPIVLTVGGTTSNDFVLEKSTSQLQAFAITGTRRTSERTVTEASVPIDVISASEMKQTGRTETSQILQMLVPSLNFPRTSIAGGTDMQRPFTLRGLTPDQTLVLVNGKRRHTGSVLALNNSIGRGTTGVDLNAIPASSIERIEVLRDGAAAQYGSDAIAGVVNVILKGAGSTSTDFSVTTGATSGGDGETFQADGSHTFTFGSNGFLNVSGEFRNRGRTNRSLAEFQPSGWYVSDATADQGRLNYARTNTNWFGDAPSTEGGLMFNAGAPIGNMQAYVFGGTMLRQATAFGFSRRARDDRNVRGVYPDGFLPQIIGTSFDASLAMGLKGTTAGFNWDASIENGNNYFRFNLANTLNPTYGLATQKAFYAGSLNSNQITANLDASRALSLGLAKPANLGVGLEVRRDQYNIYEGEAASYSDGGQRILDGPSLGRLAITGSQLFFGFRPVDYTNASRTSYAGYVDVEQQLGKWLTLGGAGRAENFSDFGGTTIGKLTARVQLVPDKLAIRGAVNTGFRAPSLAQINYSASASNVLVINGVPTPNEARTIPVNTDVARALGAKPLEAERSTSYTSGFVFTPTASFSATVDGYNIDIRDRIILSSNFTGTAIQSILSRFPGFGGDVRPRFFTNAIDTRTRGVDVVLRYATTMSDGGTLRLTASYNYTENSILNDSIPNPSELRGVSEQLFDRTERARLVEAQPRTNVRVGATYLRGPWTFELQQAQFGSFITRSDARESAAGRIADQRFSAKWVSDVSASYDFGKLRATVGADNLFNVYPDQISTLNPDNYFGSRQYSPFSPFGANGRFAYFRLAYTPR